MLPAKEFFVQLSCKSPRLANYYYFFENIGDDKMGQTRSTHGQGWKFIQDFSWNISKNEAFSIK